MTIYVGIDISKQTLDIEICNGDSKEIINGFKTQNTLKGIYKLIDKVDKMCNKKAMWYCFEHTGNYGLLLSCLLEQTGATYSAVPALEIKRSLGITRGKNDQVDAARIAIYAATHAHKLKPSRLPGKSLLKIKQLLSYRRQLVKQSTQWKNYNKIMKVTNNSISVKGIIDDTNRMIELLQEKIKQVDKQINQLIEKDDLLEKNYRKIQPIKGVGPSIAVNMLLYTKNFTAFDNPRKFICFCGLAPFAQKSGTSLNKKSKTSNLRNKMLKALLFNGANSAAMYDPQLKAYYIRKKAEGKHHNSIINAIACKLIYRMFAVIKRKEPYVNFSM